MRITRLLLIFFLLPCLWSCKNRPYPYTMQVADTLVYHNPDSALFLLEQLSDSIAKEPQSTQMYYQLLSIKAKDKTYIEHTSDSLILEVVQYYADKKDNIHLPEAYYYAGRVYTDLGDAPQALEYYQKAAEELKESTNHKLMKVIYSQTGDLFLFQGVYEEALKAYKKAHQYCLLATDKKGAIINLCNIGSTFMASNSADSALAYYRQAYKHAEEFHNKGLINMVQTRLIDLYTQLKQYNLAIATLTSTEYSISQQYIGRYGIIADLYYEIGKLDSASIYYTHMLKSNNIYALQAAHWGLAEVAQEKSDCRELLRHIQQYNALTDSIKTITDSESIRKMQSLYNYQLRKKENNYLKAKSAQQHFWIVSSLLALSLLGTTFLVFFFLNKQKKLQLKNSLKEMKRLKEEQYQRSAQFIEENKRKIEALENELQISNNNCDTIQKLLLAQKKQILRMNCKIEADQEEQALAEIAFRQSDIYCKFHDAAQGNKDIETKDWELLRIKADHCYKDFGTRLRAIYPVSDMEMKICLLLKIGISITGISLLTHRSKSAIVSARKKLYEKTHGETGKPEQWDKFIMSL